ncbi:TetR/AcrR family transcriptional regulator [Nonomuraea sp. NPDC059007]|uniref:TetR/AcrR family transcriptional regulator n=1 Tax=Nonomuraea sp. NPDC059007 TaxID=3346692 RepID=UPI0036BF66CE
MNEAVAGTDGRKARGERRRREIIEATLRVIEREGVAGVTHRSVAAEAGAPPSLALYYFATLDDLLVAALTAASGEYARQLRAIIDEGRDGVDGLAQLISDAAGPGRARALAERELTMLATRRPALRPIAGHWRATVAEMARQYTDDPILIRSLVAASDGVCAGVLLDDNPIPYSEIRALLRHALGLHGSGADQHPSLGHEG